MKFRIFTTLDDTGKDGAPCKNAQLANTVEHIWRLEYIWEVELNTIEEALNLVHTVGHPIIISDKGIHDEEDGPTIEIYNGYRE